MEIISQRPFKYFDIEWTIKYVDEIPHENEHFFYGQTKFDKREILISKNLNDSPVPEIIQQRTLYHELAHIILEEGMYNEASGDEPLVEWIGKSLYELTTNSDLFNK